MSCMHNGKPWKWRKTNVLLFSLHFSLPDLFKYPWWMCVCNVAPFCLPNISFFLLRNVLLFFEHTSNESINKMKANMWKLFSNSSSTTTTTTTTTRGPEKHIVWVRGIYAWYERWVAYWNCFCLSLRLAYICHGCCYCCPYWRSLAYKYSYIVYVQCGSVCLCERRKDRNKELEREGEEELCVDFWDEIHRFNKYRILSSLLFLLCLPTIWRMTKHELRRMYRTVSCGIVLFPRFEHINDDAHSDWLIANPSQLGIRGNVNKIRLIAAIDKFITYWMFVCMLYVYLFTYGFQFIPINS